MKSFPNLLFSLVLLTVSFTSSPQISMNQPPLSAANPEMERLAKALVGDWDTVEVMERGSMFPEGGSRTGHVHSRLASGGYTLVYEVRSDGSAGKLDGFLIIWWDKSAQLYSFLACFNNPKSPCRTRGTARWEGDAFVNDYDFTDNGKKTAGRDTFTFTPNSHTLVAAIDTGDGAMKTVITTTAKRSLKSPKRRGAKAPGPPDRAGFARAGWRCPRLCASARHPLTGARM